MSQIKDTVYVTVEYFDGQAEGDEGYPYYVASSDDLRTFACESFNNSPWAGRGPAPTEK